MTGRAFCLVEGIRGSYNNEWGLVLRTGVASVAIDPPIESWEDARRVFLASDRDAKYALSVTGTEEIGNMPFSASDFMENPTPAEQMAAAGRAFAEQVNA